jgi:hypothetical protein
MKTVKKKARLVVVPMIQKTGIVWWLASTLDMDLKANKISE